MANVLEEHPELDAHMLLTVHDELVFEVPESTVEAAAELVQDRMERAVDLEVALQADVGWGPNWADAVPGRPLTRALATAAGRPRTGSCEPFRLTTFLPDTYAVRRPRVRILG